MTDPQPTPSTPTKPLSVEDHWRQEFESNPAIKAEFMDFDIYAAFKKNEGRTKSLRGETERQEPGE